MILAAFCLYKQMQRVERSHAIITGSFETQDLSLLLFVSSLICRVRTWYPRELWLPLQAQATQKSLFSFRFAVVYLIYLEYKMYSPYVFGVWFRWRNCISSCNKKMIIQNVHVESLRTYQALKDPLGISLWYKELKLKGGQWKVLCHKTNSPD